jgi:phenylpyruvate tautomerase PptA (4-oxalocrotonate tautomerase family)
MPLYLCAAKDSAIPQSAKQQIAQSITDVHCRITGAPPTFVHVFFFASDKLAMLHNIWGGSESETPYQLFGNIRAGRNDDTKEALIANMCEGVADILDVPVADVSMATRDVEAKWVMEGGDLLPEPGEEAAWLERHNQKLAETKAHIDNDS